MPAAGPQLGLEQRYSLALGHVPGEPAQRYEPIQALSLGGVAANYRRPRIVAISLPPLPDRLMAIRSNVQ
jgi:hypothetical protein